MRYGIIAMQVAAIMVCYIMLNIPVVIATNSNIDVKIYLGDSLLETTMISPNSYIQVHVSPNSGTNKVTISVSNKTSKQIIKAVIYKCGGLDPVACMSSSPETFTGNMQKEYDWSELADTTMNYPQTGHIIILVEMAGTSSEWYGYHYRLYKHDQYSGFDPVFSDNIDYVKIHAQTSDMAAKIKDFINTRKMIPMNPAWVKDAWLKHATGFYELTSDDPPAGFQTETNSSYIITGIEGEYSFAFPIKSGSIRNPVVFNMNPSFTCGNGNCESGLGENSVNCCYDCSCSFGQYCDIDVGCRSMGIVSLDLVGQQQTGISNCYVPHNINIYVKIVGAPTGMTILNQSYKLGSNPVQPTTCVNTGSSYNCPLTVPADPMCSGDSYVLGPNTISFGIRYQDGPDMREKEVSTSFPNVVVSSWTCGNGACEASLGEDDSNCCYDCPCLGQGRYCDMEPGNMSSVRCMNDLTDNNLQISNVAPIHFYTHQPGDTVSLGISITSKPRGLSGMSPSCSMECTRDDSVPCTASCTISCTEKPSQNPNVYNSTCTMSFSISGYNQTVDYTLYPRLTASVGYRNGTETISKTLSNTFATLFIGAHWCGDGTCNPDESPGGCCYDCACPSGQYCDTKDTAYHTQGDTCKPMSGIGMEVSDIGPVDFTDSTYQHIMDFSVSVTNVPRGAEVHPVCRLAGGSVQCASTCSDINASGVSVCNIVIPSINYKTTPHYNNASNRILLDQNSVNISLDFNNGSSVASKSVLIDIPQISIEPTFHCGNGLCEWDLGEAYDNCCVDCTCPSADEYCYTGVNLAGQCLKSSQIYLMFDGMEPDPITCTIMQLEGDCIFVDPLLMSTHVMNPPDDMEVISSWYTQGNDTRDVNCVEGDNASYTCSMTMDTVEDSTEGSTKSDGMITLTISYTRNNTRVTQNITASFAVTATRIKSDYVKSCEAQIEKLEEQEAKMKKNKQIIQMILAAMWGIAIVLLIICIVSEGSCEWCCEAWPWFMCIAACVTGILLPVLSQVEGKIQEIKAQREATCNTDNFAGLSSSNMNSFDIGGLLIGAVMGIVCIICIMKAFGASDPKGAQQTADGKVPAETPSAAPSGDTSPPPTTITESPPPQSFPEITEPTPLESLADWAETGKMPPSNYEPTPPPEGYDSWEEFEMEFD